jgi:hypothetical protein
MKETIGIHKRFTSKIPQKMVQRLWTQGSCKRNKYSWQTCSMHMLQCNEACRDEGFMSALSARSWSLAPCKLLSPSSCGTLRYQEVKLLLRIGVPMSVGLFTWLPSTCSGCPILFSLTKPALFSLTMLQFTGLIVGVDPLMERRESTC